MKKKQAKKNVKAVRGNVQIAQEVAVPPLSTQSSDPTSDDDEEEPFSSPSASDSEESDEKIGARAEEAHLDLLQERELSLKAGSDIEESDEKISAGSDETHLDLLRERAQVIKAAVNYRSKPTTQLPKKIRSCGGSLIASICSVADKCSEDVNKCVTSACKCPILPSLNYIVLAVVLKVIQPLIVCCSAYNGNQKRSATNRTQFLEQAAKNFNKALREPPYNLKVTVSQQTLKPMVDEMLVMKMDDLPIFETPFGRELGALQSQLVFMQQESEDKTDRIKASSLAATSTLGKEFVKQTQDGVFLNASSEVSSTSSPAMTASSSATASNSSAGPRKRKAVESDGEDTINMFMKGIMETQATRAKIAEADQRIKSNALRLQALQNRKTERRSELAGITDTNSALGQELKEKIAALDAKIDELLGL